jgi:tRNA-dihydrouridine synthase
MFEYALGESKNPVCYNGDIKKKEDYELIAERFQETDSVMIGRGILSNPGLFGEIKGNGAIDKYLKNIIRRYLKNIVKFMTVIHLSYLN